VARPGIVEGGGAGADFCAIATGTRNPITAASFTKMRILSFTSIYARDTSKHKSLSPASVQVKTPDSFSLDSLGKQEYIPS
jgi:hypothetical protein